MSLVIVVVAVAVAVRFDGRGKPENSHSCSGNTLFDFLSCSLSRFLLVGTSLILTSFVRLLISLFDISLNDLFRLSNSVRSTISFGISSLYRSSAKSIVHDPIK